MDPPHSRARLRFDRGLWSSETQHGTRGGFAGRVIARNDDEAEKIGDAFEPTQLQAVAKPRRAKNDDSPP